MTDVPQSIMTAVREGQIRSKYAFGMARLLYTLREFTRAYPQVESDTMPEHDIVFVTGVGDNTPDKAVLDALKMNPALWMSALPDEVCIVPKAELDRLMKGQPYVADYLRTVGVDMIENQAGRLRYEAEERADQKRWERRQLEGGTNG
jgi:hypothetical protein